MWVVSLIVSAKTHRPLPSRWVLSLFAPHNSQHRNLYRNTSLVDCEQAHQDIPVFEWAYSNLHKAHFSSIEWALSFSTDFDAKKSLHVRGSFLYALAVSGCLRPTWPTLGCFALAIGHGSLSPLSLTIPCKMKLFQYIALTLQITLRFRQTINKPIICDGPGALCYSPLQRDKNPADDNRVSNTSACIDARPFQECYCFL